MSWDHEAPFVTVHREAEHIDALEHTNNTQYVTWCNETARHTTDLGLGADAYRSLDRAMALTKAEYHYLLATRLGEARGRDPGLPLGTDAC